jgi:hypothetical protein
VARRDAAADSPQEHTAALNMYGTAVYQRSVVGRKMKRRISQRGLT